MQMIFIWCDETLTESWSIPYHIILRLDAISSTTILLTTKIKWVCKSYRQVLNEEKDFQSRQEISLNLLMDHQIWDSSGLSQEDPNIYLPPSLPLLMIIQQEDEMIKGTSLTQRVIIRERQIFFQNVVQQMHTKCKKNLFKILLIYFSLRYTTQYQAVGSIKKWSAKWFLPS